MLAEHEFVTTRDARTVFADLLRILYQLGFEPEQQTDDFIIVRRGKKTAARARNITELPLRIRIEFDRGRVTVAASLETRRKPGPLHREMILALIGAVESTGNGADMTTAQAEYDLVHQRIEDDAARRRRRTVIVVVVALLVIVAMCAGVLKLAASA